MPTVRPHKWTRKRQSVPSFPEFPQCPADDLGIQMIASNRRNRCKTQDELALELYLNHWKIERLFVWLGTIAASSPDESFMSTTSPTWFSSLALCSWSGTCSHFSDRFYL